MTYLLKDEKQTAAFGSALGVHLRGGDVVLLSGELGAGKSVLARGVAASLGVSGDMPSPTFVLAIPHTGTIGVCHMDLYRLSDMDAFYSAGLHEYMTDENVALIEWPLAGLTAPVRIEIALLCVGDARRASLAFYGMRGRAEGIRESLAGWGERL